MEFYDIHSHILAKVDDGAETFEMSCRMLDMAYEEGIRHLCVTPHYNRHNADDAERPKKVMRAFRALELYAKKQYEDMHLYRGNEVMFFPDMVKYLDSGSITTMNGGRYVLVEYKPNASYHNVYSGLQQILYAGYLPVLAHVERLDCLIDEWDKLEELKESGIILQMNTDGLIGGRFDRWVRRCRAMVAISMYWEPMPTICHRDRRSTGRLPNGLRRNVAGQDSDSWQRRTQGQFWRTA